MKSVDSGKIERLVEEQFQRAAARSETRPKTEAESAHWPVITISREPCAGGTTLGRSVAERLGFACWDQELLSRIAAQSGAVESILAAVDERVHSSVMEFVRSLFVGFEYTQNEYRMVLTKVVGAIAHQGAAVVVGRGAHFILGPPRCLRVRVVCPTPERIARMVERDEVTELFAARRIKEMSSDISAFMRHHFQADISDPRHFDIIVNSGTLSVASATDLVVAAYKARFGRSFDSLLPPPRSGRVGATTTPPASIKTA
jgi:cytidylate kinase